MDPHPLATTTKPSKSGGGQATMTVAVPQDSNKRKVQRNEATSCAKLQGRAWRSQGKKKQSEWGSAPHTISAIRGTTMPVLEGWKHITNDPYVLSIVSKGYRLRFTSPPLLRKAPWEIRSPKGPQKIQGMQEQILYRLCFNRSNHQSTSGYSRVLLERIPPNIQGSGDNRTCVQNILPDSFVVHRSVPVHGITQLGLRPHPTGSITHEALTTILSCIRSDKLVFSTMSIKPLVLANLLRHWQDLFFLTSGIPIRPFQAEFTIFTDAFTQG